MKLLGALTVPTGAAVFVTVIGPLAAPAGTVAFNFVEDTNVTLPAVTPLNFTVEPAR